MKDYEKVIRALDHASVPLSDYGIYHVARGLGFKMTPSSARTRRNELVRYGVVRASGTFEKSSTGYKARQWELVY